MPSTHCTRANPSGPTSRCQRALRPRCERGDDQRGHDRGVGHDEAGAVAVRLPVEPGPHPRAEVLERLTPRRSEVRVDSPTGETLRIRRGDRLQRLVRPHAERPRPERAGRLRVDRHRRARGRCPVLGRPTGIGGATDAANHALDLPRQHHRRVGGRSTGEAQVPPGGRRRGREEPEPPHPSSWQLGHMASRTTPVQRDVRRKSVRTRHGSRHCNGALGPGVRNGDTTMLQQGRTIPEEFPAWPQSRSPVPYRHR